MVELSLAKVAHKEYHFTYSVNPSEVNIEIWILAV